MASLPDVPKLEVAIVELTNQVRTEAGLGRVTANPQLAAAAWAYAGVLARSSTFSHEADGTTMSSRIAKAGYKACQVSENLAMHKSSAGFETRALARAIVEGWLNSPGHRRNMMAPEVTEIGVSVAQAADRDPKFLAVQLFGRPETLSVAFQVSNDTAQAITLTFAGRTTDVPPRTALSTSSCSGGPLVLATTGPRALSARFEAPANGKIYLVTDPGGRGPLKVDVTERRRVR